jgi:guanylate kinase
VLLEIDWQGAAQVRRLIPESVHVFILPPSLESLKERLVRRGQDDAATIARRLIAACEEIRHYVDFNYVIINQEFASAVDDLSAVVRATRLRTAQQLVRHQPLIAQLIA